MILLTIFFLRLIFGEEAFLAARLGDSYRVYCARVPRLVPRLRNAVAKGNRRPDWVRGVLAELLPIGVFVTVAFVSWSYDNQLMARAVLISFGVSLVVRALMPNAPIASRGSTNA
jgi:K+-transporting ATPase A subunit